MAEVLLTIHDPRKIIHLETPEWSAMTFEWPWKGTPTEALRADKIKPYYETGESHLTVWFAVYVGDVITLRINSKFVVAVTYEKGDN